MGADSVNHSQHERTLAETGLNDRVLELLEARVLLQALGEELGSLISNQVLMKAATKSRSCINVSGR